MTPMKAPARAVAILTSVAVLLVALSAPALADSPSTWDEGEARSTLENLIFKGSSDYSDQTVGASGGDGAAGEYGGNGEGPAADGGNGGGWPAVQ